MILVYSDDWCMTIVMSGVRYSDDWCELWSITQWYLVYDILSLVYDTVTSVVYDTVVFWVMSGAWYSDGWCVIQWCDVYDTVVLMHDMVYDTAMSGVWYSRLRAVFCVTMFCSRNYVYLKKKTARRTPNMPVSCTCFIHQTCLYHTPNMPVSYTKHACIFD